MPAGRKPKPTALRKLTGNAGKRPLNRKEPSAPADVPSCPPHLDREAAAEWGRIVKILGQMGLLSAADKAALAIYCQSWATMVAAQLAVRKKGAIVNSPNGFRIQNPYLSVANSAAKQLAKMLGEFGLTPASRSRVHVPEKPPRSKADDFLNDDGG